MTGHNIRTYLNKSRDKSEGPLFRNPDTLQLPQMRFQIALLIVILLLLPLSLSLSLSLSLTHTHTHTHARIIIYIYVFAQQYFIQNQLLLKPNLKFKILNTFDYYGSTTPDAV